VTGRCPIEKRRTVIAHDLSQGQLDFGAGGEGGGDVSAGNVSSGLTTRLIAAGVTCV
jgi:hypothetical protein